MSNFHRNWFCSTVLKISYAYYNIYTNINFTSKRADSTVVMAIIPVSRGGDRLRGRSPRNKPGIVHETCFPSTTHRYKRIIYSQTCLLLQLVAHTLLKLLKRATRECIPIQRVKTHETWAVLNQTDIDKSCEGWAKHFFNTSTARIFFKGQSRRS